MLTIWKFDFELSSRVELMMPRGAQFLSVQMQYETPCLWAIVDSTAPAVARHLLIRGTGHNVAGVGRFVSTFQMAGEALVFHAFEDPNDINLGEQT